MKNVYRLNVRFDCADTEQNELVEKLKSLDRFQHGSINSFVIEAIRERFENEKQTQMLSETLRQVLREELQGIRFSAPQEGAFESVVENVGDDASVLEALEIFG